MRLRVAVAVVLAAVGATALLAFVGSPGRTYLDDDFVQFRAAGRLLPGGRAPYDPATFAEMQRRVGSAGHALIPGTGFWYPLPTGPVAIPFAPHVGLPASARLVAQVAVAATGLCALGRTILAPTFHSGVLVLASLAIRPSRPREWIESAVAQRAVGAIRADIRGIVPADLAWAGPPLAALLAAAIAPRYRWRRPAIVHALAVTLAFSLRVAVELADRAPRPRPAVQA